MEGQRLDAITYYGNSPMNFADKNIASSLGADRNNLSYYGTDSLYFSRNPKFKGLYGESVNELKDTLWDKNI